MLSLLAAVLWAVSVYVGLTTDGMDVDGGQEAGVLDGPPLALWGGASLVALAVGPRRSSWLRWLPRVVLLTIACDSALFFGFPVLLMAVTRWQALLARFHHGAYAVLPFLLAAQVFVVRDSPPHALRVLLGVVAVPTAAVSLLAIAVSWCTPFELLDLVCGFSAVAIAVTSAFQAFPRQWRERHQRQHALVVLGLMLLAWQPPGVVIDDLWAPARLALPGAALFGIVAVHAELGRPDPVPGPLWHWVAAALPGILWGTGLVAWWLVSGQLANL